MKSNLQRENCTVNESRYQQLMLPIDMEIVIAENDPVRLAAAQLEELDYRALYHAYSAKGRKSAVEPKILFEVLAYGYMCGIYSTRKLEEACRKRVDFMWLLCGERVPDHTTISRFRMGRAQEEIGDLFYQFNEKLEKMGETEHKEVFVDGTKIESKANKYTFVWKKSTEKHLAKVKQKVEEIWKARGNQSPVCKDQLLQLLTERKAGITLVHGKGKRKTQEQREWESVYELYKKWETYEKQLFVMGNTRNSYSKTDPEATFMHMKEDHMRNGQLKPGYNIQLAVNSEYITGVGAFSNRTDSGTLIPFLHELERFHGRKYREVTADAGYESAQNYLFLEANGQIGYIKPINYESQRTKRFRAQIGRAENMQYQEEGNCYVCKEGRRLVQRKVTTEQKNGGIQTLVYYRCENCQGCIHREACCKAQDPEKPKELQVNLTLREYREQSQARIQTDHGIQLRVNRSIQVEGAFGVLKEDRKFRRFLTGSRRKVLTELYLLCLGYNLKKLWSKKQNNRLQTHLFATEKT